MVNHPLVDNVYSGNRVFRIKFSPGSVFVVDGKAFLNSAKVRFNLEPPDLVAVNRLDGNLKGRRRHCSGSYFEQVYLYSKPISSGDALLLEDGLLSTLLRYFSLLWLPAVRVFFGPDSYDEVGDCHHDPGSVHGHLLPSLKAYHPGFHHGSDRKSTRMNSS